MLTPTASALLAEIEAYLDASGLAATAFGIAAVNDGHLVRDLRDGVDIRASKIDRVREFMAENAKPKRGRPGNAAAAA